MSSDNSWKMKLNLLDKRITDFAQGYRQNVALLGDDEEEISSLLEKYLAANVLKGIVYVRGSARYTHAKEFFKGVAVSLLAAKTGRVGTLDVLISKAGSQLPKTSEYVRGVVAQTTSPTFLEVLEVINTFINETAQKCVFIIEDFTQLKSVFPEFHHDFAKFIIVQRQCMAVLAGLHSSEAEKILSVDLHFLFGNFEKISLSETTLVDNYLYLRRVFFPLLPSPCFSSFFMNILGSNISLYDYFGAAIKKQYSYEDEEDAAVAILKQTLFCEETYLYQRFFRKLDNLQYVFRDYTAVARLLIAMSEGYVRKKELLLLGIFDKRELAVRLQKLVALSMLEHSGNMYRIRGPLFSFWIGHVFKTQFFPPIIERDKRAQLFEMKVRETIALFKEDFFKDKVKRIVELVSLFQDDLLAVGRNRYRLPLVEKTRMVSDPSKNLHFLVGEGKDMVVVGVKESMAYDSDVFEFVEQSNSIMRKGVKRIFISLDRFSAEARLAAKNNKLITWDLTEVNHLLRAYSKPIISCCIDEK